jgi:hypothetical protein
MARQRLRRVIGAYASLERDDENALGKGVQNAGQPRARPPAPRPRARPGRRGSICEVVDFLKALQRVPRRDLQAVRGLHGRDQLGPELDLTDGTHQTLPDGVRDQPQASHHQWPGRPRL